MKTKLIVITSLLLLVMTVGIAQEQEKNKFSTKEIDIILKDESGNNHFLVFSKVMTKDDSYIAYNVDFWVNNQVYLEPSEISKVQFKTDTKTIEGSYYKTNLTGSYNASDAEILYFFIEEVAIKELQSGSIVKVRVIMKNEDFKEFTISTAENFKKAVKEIIAIR